MSDDHSISGNEPALPGGRSGYDVQLGSDAGLLHLLETLKQTDSPQQRAVFMLASRGHKAAYEQLAHIAQAQPKYLRPRAVRAMASIQDARVLQFLLERATDPGEDPLVREAACEALGERGDRAAILVLRDLIERSFGGSSDPDLPVRPVGLLPTRALIKALQNLHDDGLFDYLLDKALAGGTSAVEMLGHLGDRRAVPYLLDWLAEIDPAQTGTGEVWGVMTVARGLGLIGDPQAVPALIPWLQSNARMYVAEALGRIGDPSAFTPLLEALRSERAQEYPHEDAMIRALGMLHEPRTIEILSGILSGDRTYASGTPDSRAAAAEALGNPGGSTAIGSLLRALNDRHKDVRKAAVLALGKHFTLDPRIEQGVIEALADRDTLVRRAAAEVLGNWPDARAVQGLIPLLASRSYLERYAAQRALERIGTPEALAALDSAHR